MATKEERFSLKDYLFNKKKVDKISTEISAVYPEFNDTLFVRTVLKKFPELELMERVYWIRDCLREYLPKEYRTAVSILIESLPEASDPAKSDNDFGDFIYAPYSYFIAEYGCTEKDLAYSLAALKECTTRFSVEGPIRFFINAFPKETYVELTQWTKDNHYHVRRAASEGTRPFLPWAKKIIPDFKDAIVFLDLLHDDNTRFVTRSVANHMNDISKLDAKTTIALLRKWEKDKKQNEKEMQFITQHSLRTLVKEGNSEALAMLGYSAGNIVVQDFSIETKIVTVGETLEFSFDIVSKSSNVQNLMIDYVLSFKKANGSLAPKTFKIAKKKIKDKETMRIQKSHPLKLMTTRTLYSGEHTVSLQINGQSFGELTFELKG
ncbi:DNA alkylation repair protein [Candidatus Pacebacteria bacterium]|nr:DNA alkylation repair protein [Candidatus Paceibacterota bacterium]